MKTARRIAKAVVAIAGMVTLVLGVATGNLWVVIATAAVAAGAGLLAAAADLRETEARCEAARRQHQMEAPIEQERGREMGIKERVAELRSRYAGLDGVEGGSGRFRERVAAEPEPGRHRAH